YQEPPADLDAQPVAQHQFVNPALEIVGALDAERAELECLAGDEARHAASLMYKDFSASRRRIKPAMTLPPPLFHMRKALAAPIRLPCLWRRRRVEVANFPGPMLNIRLTIAENSSSEVATPPTISCTVSPRRAPCARTARYQSPGVMMSPGFTLPVWPYPI